MKLLSIEKSDREGKKWKAVFLRDNGRKKTTHFGDATAEDYLQHHDKVRRERYRLRHWKDLETGDPTRAGFLSFHILWGDSTDMEKNIADFKRQYGL